MNPRQSSSETCNKCQQPIADELGRTAGFIRLGGTASHFDCGRAEVLRLGNHISSLDDLACDALGALALGAGIDTAKHYLKAIIDHAREA